MAGRRLRYTPQPSCARVERGQARVCEREREKSERKREREKERKRERLGKKVRETCVGTKREVKTAMQRGTTVVSQW